MRFPKSENMNILYPPDTINALKAKRPWGLDHLKIPFYVQIKQFQFSNKSNVSEVHHKNFSFTAMLYATVY